MNRLTIDDVRLTIEGTATPGLINGKTRMSNRQPKASLLSCNAMSIAQTGLHESSIVNRQSSISFSDVTALPIDRSAQPMTRDLVADDEVIILLLRPSLLYVVLSCFYNLIFIALVTFALAYMAKFMSQLPGIGWNDTQAFALGVGLCALRIGWQFLEWMSRVYILTDRRVIARSGVLRVIVFQAQLKKIQHTSVFASLRERTTGLGTIGFATAGSDTFEAFWTMIREPFTVHKKIVETLERYGR